MKKSIIVLLGVVAISLGYASKAFSAAAPPRLCGSEFDVPKITHRSDGSFYVCSSHPAAYISNEQARDAAAKINSAQANEICANGYRELAATKAKIHNFSVMVVSLFACR